MSHILTVEETAKRLRVTERTTREWLRDGKIPGRKVGKKWLIPEDALMESLRGSIQQHPPMEPAESSKVRELT